eukprot:snap_masked-scaffold15_size728074-processed-gene-0.6 protein:Tk08839 transcript:snap_masked-scaffold15_size728074-processed-gene-0.6-mRNA-1 annotation:"PREDICTED: uncharacterized protein K02A2.6-like"
MSVDPEDSIPMMDTLDSIQDFVRRRHSVLLDRMAFFRRRRSAGESMSDFLSAMKELSLDADLKEISYPTSSPKESDLVLGVDWDEEIMAVTRSRASTLDPGPIDPFLAKVRESTLADDLSEGLIVLLSRPFGKTSWPGVHAPFWSLRTRLTVVDGLILLDKRIFIPPSMRTELLRRLHTSHMGVLKTKRRARAAIWWPMINFDIDELVQRCPLCQLTRSSQPREPACMAKPPEFPFQDVAVDLFYLNGKCFLVYVDRMSFWFEVTRPRTRHQPKNRKNDRFLAFGPVEEEERTLMTAKHPASVMSLGFVASNGKAMPLLWFKTEYRLNGADYVKLLRTKLIRWVRTNFPDGIVVLKQDGAPAHTSKVAQSFLEGNIPFWSKKMWPP